MANAVTSEWSISLDDLPIPALILREEDLAIEFCNVQAENWFGQSRKELQSRNIDEIVRRVDVLKDAIKRVHNQHIAVNVYDIGIRKAGGDKERCDLTLFAYQKGSILLLQNVSRKSSHDAGDSGFAVEALGRMLAHELKNPLAGIKGAAQLLKGETNEVDAEELLSLIVTETDRIQRLAESMADFGQMDDLNFEAVNIHSTLRQARLLAQSTGARVSFTENYDPSLPDVRGHADSLMQVIINLLKNAVEAIHHSGKGDEIIIETAYRSGMKHSSVKDNRPLPIEIRIIDNGPGIPEHIRYQLFRPFVTNKPAGQGLGLTLASRIISAHSGLIEIKSEPGRTVFALLLPAYKDI